MLTRQEQMEFILDHYENPRHKGRPGGCRGGGRGRQPGLRRHRQGVLESGRRGQLVATFEGEGCTISQASASYLMDEVNGKTLDEVLAIDHEALMESLGKEIVQQRTRCATLSLDTLRAAIRKRDREQMIKNHPLRHEGTASSIAVKLSVLSVVTSGPNRMTSSLDVAKIRQDFPILERRVHDKPLVFLDSAASSQKPACVIEAMDHYYRTTHANVHRGVHTLSEEATELYEGARKKIAKFINAKVEPRDHLSRAIPRSRSISWRSRGAAPTSGRATKSC